MKEKVIQALMVGGGVAVILGIGMGMDGRKSTVPDGGTASCGSPWSPNDYGLAKAYPSVPGACAEALAPWWWASAIAVVVGVVVFLVGAYGALIAVPARND